MVNRMSPLPRKSELLVNRRRSQRVLLSMPVIVRAETEPGKAVEEETHTLIVNAHGALLPVSMPVKVSQDLVLRNKDSNEEQRCRVAYMGPVIAGRMQTGIEFRRPAPQFWHVTFPPEDWATAAGAAPPVRQPRRPA